MKAKRFLAMVLAFVLTLGIVSPVLAKTWELEEKTSLFISLLSEKAMAKVNAVGEGFAEAMVAFMYEMVAF